MGSELTVNDLIKSSIQQFVTQKIVDEINERVNEFRNELIRNKENMIAEVMNGIKVIETVKQNTDCPRYEIVFTNRYEPENNR